MEDPYPPHPPKLLRKDRVWRELGILIRALYMVQILLLAAVLIQYPGEKMRTLPLSWDTENNYWDLVLSSSRNLDAIDSNTLDSHTGAHTGEAQYCAQTVANSCRMFRNDAYFFPQEGIPYFENVLGKKPPRSLVYAYVREASFRIPLVKNITLLNFNRVDRILSGQIRITTQNGSVEDVNF